MRLLTPLLSAACLLGPSIAAQEPVPVGRGSHASAPPPGLMVDKKTGLDQVAEVENRPLHRVREDDRPIPTNKWFQNLLLQPFGTGLWAMPHRVDATAEGLEIAFPSGFSGDGMRVLAEFPLVVAGDGFRPRDSRVKDWGDWSVAFRLFESDARFVDVTLGEGMPAVWCEFTGVRPLLAAGGRGGKGSRGKNPFAFFGADGRPLSLPHTGDALGVRHEGLAFAVFAPEGTTFADTPAGVAVAFPARGKFLVVCPLPTEKDLPFFRRHALAVPRDTRLDWAYDRRAGRVTTTWKVIAEPLRPDAPAAVLQGFLPHHWRDNLAPLALDGPGFDTIRGRLKCAAGASFTLAHDFHGVLPGLPAAQAGGDKTRELLAAHFADASKKLGGDTYWGGKALQRQAQAAFIAEQTRDPSAPAALACLRESLENWFTYTPGEKGQFFARYPRHKGLVGFPASYGSQHFTDTHFHQGHFAYAAALLAGMQPDFAAGFGDMARLVARNYANPDRADTRFPRLRAFDAWRGHSFADGKGFPNGNNQESTGEAVNSWAALILLGEALGDTDLADAGVMGYAFETRAAVEYWFDPHDDVFPKAYAHNACGMIWSDGIVWGTWFTASPAWIYGIQWLPVAPHGAYPGRHPGLIPRVHADMQRELDAFEAREVEKKKAPPKPTDLRALGGELASYHLGYRMHADAPGVVREIDALWSTPGDKVAHSEFMLVPMALSASLAELGRVDWTAHGDSPVSTVYVHPDTRRRTLVAWNPTGQPRTVSFFQGATPIGSLTVPPRSLAQGPAR